MPAQGNQTQALEPAEHLVLGSYLITTGFIGGVLNFLGLVTFVRFPHILCTPSAIPEMSLFLADLCVSCLHPFSGSSALVNRWLWGPIGCQLYSMFGFLFGNYQCLVIPFIAFDRYVITSKSQFLTEYRNKRTYFKVFLSLFFFTIFWAVTPLIGWASYSLTPIQVSCSIDWYQNNTSYTSYLTALCLLVYIAPICLAAFFSYKTWIVLRNPETPHIHWAKPNSATLVMIGSMSVTYSAFFGYSLVCVWPFFAHPVTIPKYLNMLPPPMAKMASLINPIFYLRLNPRLWNCVRKMFGCTYDAEEIQNDGEDRIIWMEHINKSELMPLNAASRDGEMEFSHIRSGRSQDA